MEKSISEDGYKKAYEFLLQLRNVDLALLWTRSQFFLVIETALLGFAIGNLDKPRFLILLFIVLGITISIVWAIVTDVGCSWLKSWEEQLEKIEDEVLPDDVPIFQKNEDKAKIKPSIKINLKKFLFFCVCLGDFFDYLADFFMHF